MPTVTLAELRTRCLERAGAEYSAPGFITTDELDRYINREYRDLWRLLVDARGHEHYATTATVATVVGTETYSLASTPGDVAELLSVSVTDNSVAVPMRAYEMAEYAWLQTLSLQNAGANPRLWRYRLRGDALHIAPTPRVVRSITLVYVPTVADLTSGAPAVSMADFQAYHHRIVAAVACTLRGKKQQDASDCVAELARYDDSIRRLAAKRDARHAPRIVSRGHAWSLRPPLGADLEGLLDPLDEG